jgi:hypothetical protein
MLNNYFIDEKNGILYIESVFKGEKHNILVSLENFELVKKCTKKWTIYKDGNKLYARGYIKGEDGKSIRIPLHRLVTSCPKGSIVDHINGNGLNNCNENLRVGTHQMNNQNASIRKDNSTGYRGVSKTKGGKYRATISVNGKNIYIGTFDTAEEASDAYEKERYRLHSYVERNALPFI